MKKHSRWAWIDTTLEEQGQLIKPKVIKGDLSLPSGRADSEAINFSLDSNQSLSLQWPKPLQKPSLKGNKATYSDAVGAGADLVVTALPTGFRYDIVLRRKPAVPLEVKIPIRGEGLALKEASNGRIRIVNDKNEDVTATSTPSLRETRDPRTATHENGRVSSEISTSGKQQILVLKPDHAYLSSSDTDYPVTLQSAISIAPTADADVWSVLPDVPNGEGSTLKAGSETDGLSRAYLKFNTALFVGRQVSNATLSLLNIDGPACGASVSDGIQVRRVTSAWNPSTVTWAAQPTNTTEDATVNKNSVGGACDPTPMNWNITAMAQKWAVETANHGLMLMSPTERAVANYRVFPASEDADFNDPPKITATFASTGDAVTVYPAGPDGVEVIQTPAGWGGNMPQVAEAQSYALSSAFDRVELNPDALSSPYVDMVSGHVIVPAATADGRTIGSAALAGTAYLGMGEVDWTIPGEYTDGTPEDDPDPPTGPTEDYSFAPQVPDVGLSYSRQTSIAREVLRLTAEQLPGADSLISSRLWPERNQVLIKTKAVSPEMRLALAQRYGTSAVTLQLAPNAQNFRQRDSRDNDNDNRINGGGAFETENGRLCTMAFAWNAPVGRRLVTAGHCLPRGELGGRLGLSGGRYYGKGEKSTFSYPKGTTPLEGQNKWLGDTALVVTNSPAAPEAAVFTGDETSGTKRNVKDSWRRRANKNDLVCMGGRYYGQHCNWRVEDSNTYYKDDGAVIDNIVSASRSSQCPGDGDSGGPVYTFRSDGGVVAKGVFSGSSDPWFGDCGMAFTDIMSVKDAYGGDVLRAK